MRSRWIRFVCWVRGHVWIYAPFNICDKMKVAGGILAPRMCVRCLKVEKGLPRPEWMDKLD